MTTLKRWRGVQDGDWTGCFVVTRCSAGLGIRTASILKDVGMTGWFPSKCS